MKIQILGTGCRKCNKLYAEAEKAVATAGGSAAIEKVEKIEEIMQYGVMLTPALVIDGTVKVAGRVVGADTIAGWLLEAKSAS